MKKAKRTHQKRANWPDIPNLNVHKSCPEMGGTIQEAPPSRPIQDLIARVNHMTAHVIGLTAQLQGFSDELYGTVPADSTNRVDGPSPLNLMHASEELASAVLRLDSAVSRLLTRE